MRARTQCVSTLLAAFFLPPQAAAQLSDPVAQLAGVVHNSVTGIPVARATVRLVPLNARVGYVRTSAADGSFTFDGIAPGDYQLQVERRGFLDSAKVTQTGALFHLAGGQKITSLDVRVTPLATISGTVTDADGEPVRTIVHLLAPRWSMHGRRYQDSAGESTNDLGEFRFTNLEPGRYYLYTSRPQGSEGPPSTPVKNPAGQGELVLASRYYPNAAFLEGAAPIDLRPGQELTGIAFRLPWVPAFHIRGRVTGGTAEEIQLVGRLSPWERYEAEPARDNTFDIAGVTAGNYDLGALNNWRTGVNLPVSVDSKDVNGVSVSAILPEFRAHVRTETGGIQLHLQRSDTAGFNRQITLQVQPDGTARLPAIGAARYILWGISPTGGAYVKSVQIAQQELRTPELDFTNGALPDLEIVMARGTGSIQGTVAWPDPAVTAPPFAATDQVAAVLVPQETRPGISLAQYTDIDQNSAFAFSDIPPGKYLVFVTANHDAGLWMNREFLALVQDNGTPVELPENGTVKVQAAPLPAAVAQRAMETLR